MPQMALPVVVAAGGNTNFLADEFVYQAVLVGDASGPVAGEVVLERLRFTDALVAVALDVSKERIDPLEDKPDHKLWAKSYLL